MAYEEWQLAILREVAAEVRQQDPLVLDGLKYAEFVSRSNGRNRPKRRHLREVRLVTFNNRTYLLGKRMTRKIEHLMQDVFPEELSQDSELDWYGAFLQALKELQSSTY